jgi:CRISPR-associated protein Cmr2
MRYLFTLSVGPVQGFIAAARRTRDLWAGSWLLSEVSKAAARRLQESRGTVIFPSPVSPGDLEPNTAFTAVNKLLAVVETDDPAGLAKAARQAAYERLLEAANNLRDLRGTTYDRQRFREQLEHFLEFYCAWTPHSDDAHYARDRQRAELLFLARKSLNAFARHNGAAGVPKSSLDGIRENVILNRGKQLFESQLKDNEYLDAIGLVKRFTGTPNRSLRFESTIDVAAVPYWLGLEKNPKCEAHRAPNPPYYALLIADGDRMGAAIEAISERNLHQQFSLRLSEFAGEAARVIEGEPYRGCPVYVGGDDVMALLPLHMALECVCEVRNLFLDKMRGPWPEQPTFSAGLAVVHALEPLTEAREIAMRAERAAKDPRKGDRDALAVIHAPRSGPEMLAYGKFPEFPERLLKIAELYRGKALSLGFAHELRNLLGRTPRELDEVLGKMAKAIGKKKEAKEEALRLLESCSNRDQLDNLYRALLVARPFYRAKNEAGL